MAGRLETGELDLCPGTACQLPSCLLTGELATTPHVMLRRKGHPRGAAMLDECCALDHVNVARDSSLHGFIDQQW